MYSQGKMSWTDQTWWKQRANRYPQEYDLSLVKGFCSKIYWHWEGKKAGDFEN